MIKLRSILRAAAVAFATTGLAGAALQPAGAAVADWGEDTLVAAADCYSIGQSIAAQNGGTLAKASQANRGGQNVCVIVVLVPGKDGQRPRRMEIVVPQD